MQEQEASLVGSGGMLPREYFGPGACSPGNILVRGHAPQGIFWSGGMLPREYFGPGACSPGNILKSWYSLVASRASFLQFGKQIELPNSEYL